MEFPKSIVLDPERIKVGIQVYEKQACVRCHSISGKENPRNPLDDVDTRRTAEALREWIIGADTLKGKIPERVFRSKQVYQRLPGGDVDDLVIYVQSLFPEVHRTRPVYQSWWDTLALARELIYDTARGC